MITQPVLALLPGLLLTRDIWSHQIEVLSEHYDIVVGDFSKQNSIAEMAQELLKQLPGRFLLCGISMGGYVALEIMRQAPERVDKLVLFDTQARPEPEEGIMQRRKLMKQAMTGRFKGVTPRLLPLLVHPEKAKDSAIAERIMAMAAEIGRDGFLRQEKAIIERQSALDLLPLISCPTLVVCGQDDRRTPVSLSEEMAKAIPNAQLEIIEDCGHLPPIEQPQKTSQLLKEWLVS